MIEQGRTRVMRLAHFTDLHLPIREKPALRQLMNKRVLGYQSWLRKRHKRHQQWALDALVDDAKAQRMDAALMTGDVTNIALPSEFVDAAAWMERQLAGIETALVPGNHDSYVDLPWAHGMGLLEGHMRGWSSFEDAAALPPRIRVDERDFPFIAETGFAQGICVICANSSPPTAPAMASGRLGAAQIAAMETLLKEAGNKGHYRLILIHHPVTEGVVSWRKSLHDAPAFQDMIERAGAELILHGHTHFPVHAALNGPDGPVPVIGGGSASHTHHKGRYTAARYNLIDISRGDNGHWQTHVTIRELRPADRSVTTAAQASAADLTS